jgi:hypothetical protein
MVRELWDFLEEWNILEDADFERAYKEVAEADHMHIAWPC